MIKRTIVLPVLDNDGKPLAKELEAAEAMFLEIVGGYTCADATGSWRDPKTGITYTEANQTYTIVSDEWEDQAVQAIIPKLAEALRQVTIYTESTIVDVSFVAKIPLEVAA